MPTNKLTEGAVNDTSIFLLKITLGRDKNAGGIDFVFLLRDNVVLICLVVLILTPGKL
ncbi:hypothetical protein [Mucilaginibacter ginsenosidivorax]|uniref:hypothetical protein n=1 Tax=Mucilaginibacter ginsenosidivorax TaxID=862126 RepID=UPI00131527C6|nr:hypothetical protein [Mucilaginibacter ginsenosidivorax]